MIRFKFIIDTLWPLIFSGKMNGQQCRWNTVPVRGLLSNGIKQKKEPERKTTYHKSHKWNLTEKRPWKIYSLGPIVYNKERVGGAQTGQENIWHTSNKRRIIHLSLLHANSSARKKSRAFLSIGCSLGLDVNRTSDKIFSSLDYIVSIVVEKPRLHFWNRQFLKKNNLQLELRMKKNYKMKIQSGWKSMWKMQK